MENLKVLKVDRLAAYVGSVLQDVELKYSNNNAPYVHINLGFETDEMGDDGYYKSEFVRLSLFGGDAIYYSNLKKQDVLEVKGIVRKEEFTRQDGTVGVSYKIPKPMINVGSSVRFRLDKKTMESLNNRPAPQATPAPQAPPVNVPPEVVNIPQAGEDGFVQADDDDLIPFT